MYNIPLPEFWFPPGWKIEPDRFIDDKSEKIDGETNDLVNNDETTADKKSKLIAHQRARAVCQQIAKIFGKSSLILISLTWLNMTSFKNMGAVTIILRKLFAIG